MPGDATITKRGGWCELMDCEEGRGAPDPVVVFEYEDTEIEVCDACLIRLSSGPNPGEMEEANELIVKLRDQIEKMEVEHEEQVRRMIAAANQDLAAAKGEGSS